MKKKFLGIILCMAMILTVLSNPMISGAAGDTAKESYTKSEVEEFHSNGTFPTKTGYVFAGWYADQELTSPVKNTIPDIAYPKFVDEKVLQVKLQLRAGTTLSSANTDLRLVTSVDSLNYKEVGFKVQVGESGRITPLTSKTVYMKITGFVDSKKTEYTPGDAFENTSSQYFMTKNLTGVSEAYFSTGISVTPFWTTLDGTTVEGTVRVIKIDDVADYDNGVDLSGYVAVETKLNNSFDTAVEGDFSETGDRTAFFGSAASLKDGWLNVTSDEHVFTYGIHNWGRFGGVTFANGKTYKVDFDLKLGETSANPYFHLYVVTGSDATDPRSWTPVEALSLDFSYIKGFVNSEETTAGNAHVTYEQSTKTAHVEFVFTADTAKNTLLVSKCTGTNNWLIDNLVMSRVVEEKDYDNGVTFTGYSDGAIKFENDFSESATKGVTQSWHKSPFNGSTAVLEDGWARVTSTEHVFVYGGHAYGNYGGFSLDKDKTYKTSFDLKLGTVDANKTFNLYVMTENGDPRFGNIVKTLTLNFEDFTDLVTENTDNFAHVTYNKSTHTAHIEILYTTDTSVNTDIVSKCAGDNNWLIDNLVFRNMEKDYDNGVDFSDYTVTETKFENDFSESATKGVTAAWHKSPFQDSNAVLDEGWARVTSSEHVFVYGAHTWAYYGAVDLGKYGETYKTSFDLKLGSEDANKIFNLYVMTENGDPRFGDIVKTLTLDFGDLKNPVTTNTDNFASVKYNSQTQTMHIEILYTTDTSVNTDIVSRCSGANNWLIDNMKFEKVTK